MKRTESNEFKSISKQILELNTQVSTNNTKNTSISMNIGDLESEIGSIRHSIDNQTEEKEKLDRFQDDLSPEYLIPSPLETLRWITISLSMSY